MTVNLVVVKTKPRPNIGRGSEKMSIQLIANR